ncbi:hypothetical protein C7401_1209 [Paraburkholderia unamae]|nr:hypothetical protein C7401_1209 [Paraburkholderia unamae]
MRVGRHVDDDVGQRRVVGQHLGSCLAVCFEGPDLHGAGFAFLCLRAWYDGHYAFHRTRDCGAGRQHGHGELLQFVFGGHGQCRKLAIADGVVQYATTARESRYRHQFAESDESVVPADIGECVRRCTGIVAYTTFRQFDESWCADATAHHGQRRDDGCNGAGRLDGGYGGDRSGWCHRGNGRYRIAGDDGCDRGSRDGGCHGSRGRNGRHWAPGGDGRARRVRRCRWVGRTRGHRARWSDGRSRCGRCGGGDRGDGCSRSDGGNGSDRCSRSDRGDRSEWSNRAAGNSGGSGRRRSHRSHRGYRSYGSDWSDWSHRSARCSGARRSNGRHRHGLRPWKSRRRFYVDNGHGMYARNGMADGGTLQSRVAG